MQQEPSAALKEILANYRAFKQLPDGRWVGALQLMYHWTIHVGIDCGGYTDRWCISSEELALDALENWDGEGEPRWWHKHPSTGRYRDLVSGATWTDGQLVPEEIVLQDWPFNFTAVDAEIFSPSPGLKV